MAIQDYVQSIGADNCVSKGQVFRFLEMEFARADTDHDGKLSFAELSMFVRAIYCSAHDQR
jgi:hypothetical protein